LLRETGPIIKDPPNGSILSTAIIPEFEEGCFHSVRIYPDSTPSDVQDNKTSPAKHPFIM
jgi:hypothetical protein